MNEEIYKNVSVKKSLYYLLCFIQIYKKEFASSTSLLLDIEADLGKFEDVNETITIRINLLNHLVN